MPDVRLGSFNSHYGVVADRHPPRRHFDVAPTLLALDADILVVQESMRPDGERGDVDAFAAEHGYELHFAIVGRTTLQTRWPRLHPDAEGTSGISVLSRLPIRRLDDIVVGHTPGDPAPKRSALHVEVDVGGSSLHVVGVHLTSRLPYGPPVQLSRLARGLPPRGTPTVIVGDCNLWGPPVTALLPGFRRAVRGRTWPARFPHSQIDHVLVRRGEVEVLESEVLGRTGSDHLPVRVVLRVSGNGD